MTFDESLDLRGGFRRPRTAYFQNILIFIKKIKYLIKYLYYSKHTYFTKIL